MVDLVVIHPGAAHGIYGVLGDKLVAVEPPLWARLITGYALDQGLDTQIIDAEALQLSPLDSARMALLDRPGLVCIAVYGHQPSASTQQMDGASLTAKFIKELDPQVKVIMVGGHVAALPKRTLEEEDIDFACNSEGPETVVRLAKLIGETSHLGSSLAKIPGLVWRHHEHGIISNPAPPLLDVDKLHGNVWSMLPMERYRAHNWQCFGNIGERQPYASIYTSLGCPYSCSFCCINSPFDGAGGGHRYRMRKPEDVVWEISSLRHDWDVRTFKIVDEMFVLNVRHYSAICEGLIDAGIGDEINIWAYARVDTVRADRLELLRRAGVRWLALGIESASAYVLDGADKRLKPRDIADVVDAIQRAGINVIGNFIFGLPDDTEQTMRETLDLAKNLRLDFANFYSAMAYPGSPLYTEALEKGWTLPETWRGYSQHNDDCRPLDTLHIPAAKVLKFRDQAFQEFFVDKQYLDRTWQKFGDETMQHVTDMTRYKLTRKLLEGTIA